jgi:hypothetical protein
MLVRVNLGWKAGQIQDIEPVAARQMLADGRASTVDYDPGPKKAPSAAADKAATKKAKQ